MFVASQQVPGAGPARCLLWRLLSLAAFAFWGYNTMRTL